MMVSTSSRRCGRDQPGERGVPGLVRRDQALLVLGVADGLAEPDLGHQPRVLDVRPRTSPRPRGGRR